MIHIIKNEKTKLFEVKYTDRKGDFLSGTVQGYERKAGCFKEIRSEMKHCFGMVDEYVIVQDDTTPEISMYRLFIKSKLLMPTYKPKKRYQPKK